MITKPSISSLLPAYMVIFIGFIGYSLMITVFTPMFMYAHNGILPMDSTLSYRIIMLGIVLCLYPLGQFFGSPVLGALSDHFGRKSVLMISLYITTVCYFFIAFSLKIQSLALLMASSLLAGLSEANIVIAQSAIADVTPREQRQRFFGYIYLSASSAYIIGPLIGGKLADPHLVSWFNYDTPFWLVFILLALTTLWTGYQFRETKVTVSQQPIHYFDAFTNLFTIFTDKRIRTLYLINFLLYFAIFGFFRCYPMYLVDEFHMDVSKESEFIAWVAVPIILANLWLTGFVAKRLSATVMTILSALFTGIFMIIVIIPNSENTLWLTLFLTGLALALCLPACATLLSISVNENEQGRVMGNNQSLQVGAEALSGLLGGLLAAIMVKLSLIVLGMIAIIAAIVLYFYSDKLNGKIV